MSKVLDEEGVIVLSSNIKTLSDSTYPANAVIASGYNSSISYAVGDYCLVNGLLFKCNTAIGVGGETWTSAHWTQVSVTNEITSITSRLEQKLLYVNTAVPSVLFASDSTYEDFPYRVAIALSSVNSSMVPELTFSLEDAVGGIFAPVAETYNGGIYAYANEIPENTTIIPTIICWWS